MTAAAPLHMNSMASWSPSQSDPSRVVHVPTPIVGAHVPRAAEIPPAPRLYDCGWEHFGQQAVRARFGQTESGAQSAPSGADETIVGVVDQFVFASLL